MMLGHFFFFLLYCKTTQVKREKNLVCLTPQENVWRHRNTWKAPHLPPQRSSIRRRLVCRLPSAARIPSIPFLRQNLNSMPHRLDGGQRGAAGSTKQSSGSDLGPRNQSNHQLSSDDVGRVQRFSVPDSYHEDRAKEVGSEVCAANQRLRLWGGLSMWRLYAATPGLYAETFRGLPLRVAPAVSSLGLVRGGRALRAKPNYLPGSSVNSQCGLGREARQSWEPSPTKDFLSSHLLTAPWRRR